MGRRPLEENEQSKRIIVRVGPTVYDAVRSEAKEDGMTVSEWIRRAVDYYLIDKETV